MTSRSISKVPCTNSAQVTAQLTMPLYEGGAIYSQTRQAEQTVGQRRSQVDDARRAAVQTATQFWSTLQAARASISSFAAAVRAAQIALEGTQQEALVGTRTVLDVLIAKPAAAHDPVPARHRAARCGARRVQPGGGDRPADRARAQTAGEALRHGAALQAGEGQVDRLPRRSFGVSRRRSAVPLANPRCACLG